MPPEWDQRCREAVLKDRAERLMGDDEQRVATFMDMAWCSLEAEGGAASVPVDQGLCDSLHRLLNELALLRQTLGDTARREGAANARAAALEHRVHQLTN